jgi:hypothetical protein
MKKLFLFAAVAGLGLVSAHPPQETHGGGDRWSGPREARGGYPPCARGVTDNCIQLYERGVRRPDNLALNHGSERRPTEMAHRTRHGSAHAMGHEHDADCGHMAAAKPDERRVLVRHRPHSRHQLAARIRRAGERG